MNLIEFKDFLGEIYKFYRYKTKPEQDEIELWLTDLKYIPGEALPWIFSNIKNTKNSLPKNLPRTIKQQWGAYLDAHPEKFTRTEEKPGFNCPECHGVGVLHFKPIKPKSELTYTYIAICAGCNASHNRLGYILHEGGKVCYKNESGSWIPSGEYIPAMLKLTRQEIIDRGWELLESENKYAEVAYNPE